MNTAERLDWDSDFFGYSIGLLHLNDGDFDSKLHLDQRFELTYVFSDKEQLHTDLPDCIDIKLNYTKIVDAALVGTMHPNIEIYEGGMCDDLTELALLSGQHSRFKRDQKLSPHFAKLYMLWIENSLNKKIADAVLVYKESNAIVGFVTLKNAPEHVQIGLIAVSEKHQGKGIGASLLNAIPALFSKNEIIVSTQGENEIASAFYQKNGYQLDSKKYIYHLWK